MASSISLARWRLNDDLSAEGRTEVRKAVGRSLETRSVVDREGLSSLLPDVIVVLLVAICKARSENAYASLKFFSDANALTEGFLVRVLDCSLM